MSTEPPPLWTPSKTLTKRRARMPTQDVTALPTLRQEKNEDARLKEAVHNEPENFRAQQWRLALAEACSDLLGAGLDELREAYAEYLQHGDLSAAVPSGPRNTIPARTRFFEDLSLASPRDFVDYVIIRTLRQRDVFELQNSRSWTFNLMDRSGDGRAYLAEFVRYAPHMSPVTDSATAELVFHALSRGLPGPQPKMPARAHRTTSNAELEPVPQDLISSSCSISKNIEPNSSEAYVDFERWDAFLVALGKVFSKTKPEWAEAKQLLRLDPGEPLVKAQAAIDHSGTFPIPGKLFLSERYLCFVASIGWGHYLLPLGTIQRVRSTELPVFRRDALVIEFVLPKITDRDAKDPYAKFMPENNSIDGLVLSFNEFRSTRRRDAWHCYVQEMAMAHALSRQHRVSHLDASAVMDADGSSYAKRPQRTFVSLRNIGETEKSPSDTQASLGAVQLSDNASNASNNNLAAGRCGSATNLSSNLEWLVHCPTPAFARVARLNILRSRALKRVFRGCLTSDLFVFSTDNEEAAAATTTGFESSVGLLELKRKALRRYVDAAYRMATGQRSWWFARAIQRVNINMEANRRRQGGRDNEALDLVSLGNQISTFIELVTPIGCMFDAVCYVIRWNRPVLSAAVLTFFIFLVVMDAVAYLLPLVIFGYCVLLISVRNALQKQTTGTKSESSNTRAAYLSGVFARVHHGLVATQVWLQHMNRHLEKFESIHLWRNPALTRQYIYGLVCCAVILLIIPFRWVFAATIIYVFTLQFRDPERQDFVDRWYASVPGRLT
ncbi:hypothetical protein F1559_001492 [Cyanidiococcus yangmingshanensis]|uniref:GRAM domain-containing protein n=1 Tax=Cyanidiococcus yangmingshanensis TaxID=2690220 RepID=A0A7J7IEV5_9RHOD|nr:hypothetical protein F1559_001492 [Cyanidiococcus yangmingshanensis]